MKFLGFILEKCMGFTCTGLAAYLMVAYVAKWLPFGINTSMTVLLAIWAYLGLPIAIGLGVFGHYLLLREEIEKKAKKARELEEFE